MTDQAEAVKASREGLLTELSAVLADALLDVDDNVRVDLATVFSRIAHHQPALWDELVSVPSAKRVFDMLRAQVEDEIEYDVEFSRVDPVVDPGCKAKQEEVTAG